MDNLKCLSNHVSAHASIDFIDACETLRKELLKSMKIAKKSKEELKLANLEKEELVVRLDESNKKNEFLRNQISSQDEKMKSLEQELVEFKTKIENLTYSKFVVDNKSVSVSFKSKTEKVYIPHFKRNNNEKAYFARLDKGKSFDVDAEISKPKSKPIVREHNKLRISFINLMNDILNFIEIMNLVFAIEIFIFGCENRVIEEVFGRLLKFM